MTDTPQREMTLDEWVAKLPPFHRAVQELADLKERATAEAVPEPATRRDDFEEQDARYLDRLAGEIDTNESTHHWRQDVAFLQSVAAKIRRSQPTLRAPEVTDEDVERFAEAIEDGETYEVRRNIIRRELERRAAPTGLPHGDSK